MSKASGLETCVQPAGACQPHHLTECGIKTVHPLPVQWYSNVAHTTRASCFDDKSFFGGLAASYLSI